MYGQRDSMVQSPTETNGAWNSLNYNQMKEQCQKLFSENTSLRNSLKELSESIEKKDDSVNAPLQTRISEQEDEITKIRMQLDQYQKLTENLQKLLDDEKNSSTKYQQQWKDRMKEVVEKNNEIKDANERIMQLTDENARIGKEFEAERRVAQRKQKELKNEYDEYVQYTSKLEREIEDLKQQNAELISDNTKLKVGMFAEAFNSECSDDKRLATPSSSDSSSPESSRRRTDHRSTELQKALKSAESQAAAYKDIVSGFKAELSALKQTVQIETTKIKSEALHSLASAVSLLQAYDGQGLYISQSVMQVWPTLDSVVEKVAKDDLSKENLLKLVDETRLKYADMVIKFANLRQLYDDSRERLRAGLCDKRVELESKVSDLTIQLSGATSDVECWKSQFAKEQTETKVLKSAKKAIEKELEEIKQKLLEETSKLEFSQKELQRANEKLKDCRDYRQRYESAEYELQQVV